MAQRLRWQALIAGGVALLALLLLYLGYTTVTTELPDYGGAYVEGVVGNPTAINPLFAFRNDPDKDLVALIFSGLTRRNARGELEPELARTWQISPDGKVYTFNLRDDITWHDGAPFTAADVVFTIKTLQDPAFPLAGADQSKFWRQVQVKATDDHTVQFELNEPFAPFLSYTTLGILPAHPFTGASAAQMENSPFNANPVGTGPFRLKDATIEMVTLEANPNYFRGRPYLNNIVFRYYPDYPTATTAMKQKRIQGLLLRPEEFAREELEGLTSGKAWKLYLGPSSRYNLIFLNLKQPLFQDKAVRQALLYYLDRPALVEAVAAGRAEVANSPLIPNTWAYDAEVKAYDHDPERAETLLQEAGWKKGADGLWAKGDQKLSFLLFSYDDPALVRLGWEVTHQLAEAGIKVDFQQSGFSGLLRDFVQPRKFQALLASWDMGYDPDLYSAWHSSQIKEDGYNFSSFSMAKVDELLLKGRQTVDQAERIKLYQEFQEIFAEEAPALLLYYPSYTYLADKEVQGVRLGVLFEPSDRFADIGDWFVKTKRGR